MNKIEQINQLFKAARIRAEVSSIREGLRTRQYLVNLAVGEKVSKIRGLKEELSLAVRSLDEPSIKVNSRSGHVIIETTTTDEPIKIQLSEILNKVDLDKYNLPLVLGKDMFGGITAVDLADAPHLLIGGTTGAGKSVLSKAMLCSLVSKYSPRDIKLVLVDPKGTELSEFAESKYCLQHVVEADHASKIFEGLVGLMEERYAKLSKAKLNDWKDYRKLHSDEPFVVIMIDELADLLMQDKKKYIEIRLIRLLQKARAAGIHVIANTQRPSREVVSGLIKSNMPVQIALKTASNYDSRVILGEDGAEKLVGKGDMLIKCGGNLIRVQGAIAS